MPAPGRNLELKAADPLLLDLPACFGIDDGDLLGGSHCDLILAGPTTDVP